MVPFRTSPLFALVFVVLSFFSFCWDVRRRRFYLCLPFSLRCWGNPNPLRGLGFPLCFFFVATLSDFDPFILIRTFSEVRLQPLFFFFFSFFVVVVARWSGGGRLRSCSGSFYYVVVGCCLSACLVFGLVGCFFAQHARCIMHSFPTYGGRGTIIPRPLLLLSSLSCFGVRVRTGGPHAVQRAKPVSPPPPPSCRSCKGQPRKGVGEERARQPYCHTLLG